MNIRNYFQAILDRVLGFDFFIAYSHDDNDSFTGRLFEALEDHNYSVFLDKEGGYNAGDNLNRGTYRFAGNARRLIIIAGKHSLQSKWVLGETEASQSRNRVQIVIDDERGTFEATDNSHALKEKLLNRLWISREPDDANFDVILLNLMAGFKEFRRESRAILTALVATATILSIAIVALWLGYEREKIAENERVQRYLAEVGTVTTQVQGALRATPPRREDALRLALGAVKSGMDNNRDIPISSEQSLRDALYEIGGIPINCGPDRQQIMTAPLDMGQNYIAMTSDDHICVWDKNNLKLIDAYQFGNVIFSTFLVNEQALWTIDTDAKLSKITSDGLDLSIEFVGVLGSFSKQMDEFSETLSDTYMIGRKIIQNQFQSGHMAIWDIANSGEKAILARKISGYFETYGIFNKHNKLLLRVRDFDAAVNEHYCLFDTLSEKCLKLPVSADFQLYESHLSGDGRKLFLMGEEKIAIYIKDKSGSWSLLSQTRDEQYKDGIEYAYPLSNTSKVFITTRTGLSSIWDFSNDNVKNLPTMHGSVGGYGTVEPWLSEDGGWLVLWDILKSVHAFRLHTTDEDDQIYFPLNTVIEQSVKTASIGGQLISSYDQNSVAYADHDANVIVLRPEESSILRRKRILAAHQLDISEISYSQSGDLLFTLDHGGVLRAWQHDVFFDNAHSLMLPLGIDVDPIPDQGAFAEFESNSAVAITNTENTSLLVAIDGGGGYFAYDLDALFNGKQPNNEIKIRKAKPDDFPNESFIPNSISIKEAKKNIPAIDIDDGNISDANYYALENKLVTLEPDPETFENHLKIYSPQYVSGRVIEDESGAIVSSELENFAHSPNEKALFILRLNKEICKINFEGHSGDGSAYTVICNRLPPNFSFSDDAGLQYVFKKNSQTDILRLGYESTISFDPDAQQSKIEEIEQPPGFCHEKGFANATPHIFYWKCEDFVYVYDAEAESFISQRFTAPGSAIAVEFAVDENSNFQIWIGDSLGNLQAHYLSRLNANLPFESFETSSPFATGRLVPPARISQIIVHSADNDTTLIFTGDGNGEVWRWIKQTDSDAKHNLMQTVRLSRHKGRISDLNLIEKDGNLLIVSAAMDNMAHITSNNISNLVNQGMKVLANTYKED